MTRSHGPRQHPDYLRSLTTTAVHRPGLWIVPLASALLIAVLAGFLGPKQWSATQSFLVREEVIGRIVGPGRFDSLDAMKTAQETIQQAARRPSVLREVLTESGVENPSEDDVESLQQAISFYAAGGAELGKTEMLSMKVKADTPEKAKQIVELVFEKTRREVRAIRKRKAESMILEVEQAVSLANERLTETSGKLRELEASVGGDLSELRGLNEPFSGGSELRRTLVSIESETRKANADKQKANQLLEYLQGVAANPDELIATPRELLESQPALSQLKGKLIEAQVNRSRIAGIYSPKHPRYRASNNSVVDIGYQINRELEAAMTGLDSQRRLAQQRLESLMKQSNAIKQRISNLASLRVDYGQLVTETGLRNQELTEAHKEYAQAEAIHRAAVNVDLVSKMDEARAGIRPLGPGKKTLVLGAVIVGGLIGLGLVMIVTPVPVLNPPAGSGPYAGQPEGMHPEISQSSGYASGSSRSMAGQRTSQTRAVPSESAVTYSQDNPTSSFIIPDIGPASSMPHQNS